MATVSVYNMTGATVGTMELSDEILGVEINEHLVKMAVTAHLAAMRQGTQKAKTRSEVSGGGKKPWRQKGTGHARQGSTRAPQWTHGGVVFAPTPREYSFKINRKEKQAALKSALTSRVSENKAGNGRGGLCAGFLRLRGVRNGGPDGVPGVHALLRRAAFYGNGDRGKQKNGEA